MGIIAAYGGDGLSYPDGLKSHWKMEERTGYIKDSKNVLDLVVVGSPTQTRGKFGYALEGFSGANYLGPSYNVNAGYTINDSSKRHAIECWAKFGASSGAIERMVVNHASGATPNAALFLWVGATNLLNYGENTAGAQVAYDVAALRNDGKWHYIVGLYDGAAAVEFQLWVDGVQVATKDATHTFASAAGYITIGTNANNTAEYFRGGLDSVGYWQGNVPSSAIIARRWSNGRGREYGI